MVDEKASQKNPGAAGSGTASKDRDPAEVAQIAAKPEASKPPDVRERDWRRYRIAAGHMVVIRSHFKSIYLIPMALISLLCGVVVVFSSENRDARETMGLVWIVAFCLYMNIFIFEWTRAWTFVLLVVIAALLLIGVAFNDPVDFPVWGSLGNFLDNLNFEFSQSTFFFFAIFFGLCAGVSWLKTRLNYVVVEQNELQIYRNALFGDRERVSMLHPRVEVRVTDMLEYFHPFYRAGQIIIHAPSKTIVLDNVLQIRKIERVTDRLGSSLSVTVSQHS